MEIKTRYEVHYKNNGSNWVAGSDGTMTTLEEARDTVIYLNNDLSTSDIEIVEVVEIRAIYQSGL